MKRARRTARTRSTAPARGRALGRARDPLSAPIRGAEHRVIAGVKLDIVRAANGRVKRVVYPPGFRWSTHIRPIVGTGYCMHAHVGFLARGRVQGRYRDGCAFEIVAPQVVAIEPGHDAWVTGAHEKGIEELTLADQRTSRGRSHAALAVVGFWE